MINNGSMKTTWNGLGVDGIQKKNQRKSIPIYQVCKAMPALLQCRSNIADVRPNSNHGQLVAVLVEAVLPDFLFTLTLNWRLGIMCNPKMWCWAWSNKCDLLQFCKHFFVWRFMVDYALRNCSLGPCLCRFVDHCGGGTSQLGTRPHIVPNQATFWAFSGP